MPDRHESTSFLDLASSHGFIWRHLRRIQKSDLLTPISIYQIILGPRLSPETRQLDSGIAPSPELAGDLHQQTEASPEPESQASKTSSGIVSSPQASPEPAQLDSGTNTPQRSTPGDSMLQTGAFASPHQASLQTLLVLDFDWSMIEENSDTFVVRELGGWDCFQRCCSPTCTGEPANRLFLLELSSPYWPLSAATVSLVPVVL